MAAEIYLIDEVESLVHSVEDLDEWNKLVEATGLKGQQSLKQEDKSPIPFPFMNEGMKRVYNTLCPDTETAEKYNKTTIPVRVLSVIALCKQEGYFDELQIWSDNATPDPIVVGIKKDPDSDWRKYLYLIARWGDELRSYPELVQIAKARFKEQQTARLNTKILECNEKLHNIDMYIEKEFSDRSVYWPA